MDKASLLFTKSGGGFSGGGGGAGWWKLQDIRIKGLEAEPGKQQLREVESRPGLKRNLGKVQTVASWRPQTLCGRGKCALLRQEDLSTVRDFNG